MTPIALVLSAVFGFGFTDLIKHGHRATALALAPIAAVSTALADTQWSWIMGGAITGSFVAIAVDSSLANQTWWIRLRTVVASVGASCALTPLLISWRHWAHTHENYFGVGGVLAFIAWPVLVKVRQLDWGPVIDRLVRRRTGD